MTKKLPEMTLNELWELFPIVLSEHQPQWHDWYREEAGLLVHALPKPVCINHIGSTAVDGIWAKPIIDLLVEAEASAFEDIHTVLLKNGYLCMQQNAERRDYNKGYTEKGYADKVFHLHLRQYGDNDELYFRDYLRDHPDTAKEYERLKLSLWKRFEHDRDAYTDGKGSFIKKHTEIAKGLLGKGTGAKSCLMDIKQRKRCYDQRNKRQ